MKKRLFLMTLFIPTLIFSLPYNNSGYDFYTPKINHGELDRLDMNQIEEKLGLDMFQIIQTPNDEDRVDSDYASLYSGLDGFIIKGFFEQTIDEIDTKILRVMYAPLYGDTEREFSYQKIYLKTNDDFAELCFEGFMTYQEYGWQSDLPEVFGGAMLIIRNNSIDGVMVYQVRYKTQYQGYEDMTGVDQKTHEGFVYFFNEEKAQYKGYVDEADIHITASWPLIDNNDDIFHYTIQNAFDQNPATSYVEDTEDDLMEGTLIFSENYYSRLENTNIQFSGIWMINGYAQNKNLYYLNNRIKKMGKHILAEQLEYQFISYGKNILGIGLGFGADDLFEGSKFNDTCLAEIDFQVTTGNRLFGGYYE